MSDFCLKVVCHCGVTLAATVLREGYGIDRDFVGTMIDALEDDKEVEVVDLNHNKVVMNPCQCEKLLIDLEK